MNSLAVNTARQLRAMRSLQSEKNHNSCNDKRTLPLSAFIARPAGGDKPPVEMEGGGVGALRNGRAKIERMKPTLGDAMETVIFVEASQAGAGEAAMQASIDAGMQPILITANPSRYTFLQNVCVIQADTDNYSALLREVKILSNEHKISGIISTFDYYVRQAAELAVAFNLPGPTVSSVIVCKSKHLMREALASETDLNPKYRIVRNSDHIHEFICAYGLPVIIKPASNAGGAFVKLCHSEEEAVSHFRSITNEKDKLEWSHYVSRLTDDVLIEEYVPGCEYAVTTFNGKAQIVSIHTPSGGISSLAPGRDLIMDWSDPHTKRVLSAVEQTVEKLNISWGPAHIQIRLDREHMPKIIEVNPRLPGGMIAEMGRVGYGIDLVQAHVLQSCGKEVRLERSTHNAASLRYLSIDRSGVPIDIYGLDLAIKTKYVTDVKSRLRLWEKYTYLGGGSDRFGHVLTVAPTEIAASAAADEAYNKVRLIWSSR
ncbi:acetyl-CoA carboxylase biotin carboxylase subunit family protein [Bosea sp. 685]|uniref:ATP-grasp domain-containing protein n=1 Tax=Bosea sp. 685 TaxID=3080057 RepID=UPI0028933D6D|nr:ATP-grasp domain-containing protein [Bosea sp. 685]WNJ89604.1 ATP-grasp domain-containing protein [Bosea sp. 685]